MMVAWFGFDRLALLLVLLAIIVGIATALHLSIVGMLDRFRLVFGS
jgi:hypothetical protein